MSLKQIEKKGDEMDESFSFDPVETVLDGFTPVNGHKLSQEQRADLVRGWLKMMKRREMHKGLAGFKPLVSYMQKTAENHLDGLDSDTHVAELVGEYRPHDFPVLYVTRQMELVRRTATYRGKNVHHYQLLTGELLPKALERWDVVEHVNRGLRRLAEVSRWSKEDAAQELLALEKTLSGSGSRLLGFR